jgi:tetratricopeptide (TPR) repeat protein
MPSPIKKRAVELTDDHHPNKPMYLLNLGASQHSCFEHLGKLADLENAISNKKWAVELTHDSHLAKPGRLSNLGASQQSRFQHLGELADLENAISNQKQAVELTCDNHPAKPDRLCNLGTSQQLRFERFGRLADLENATSNLKQAVRLTDDHCPGKPMYLSNLGNCQDSCFRRFNKLADLEDAIFNKKRAVELTDDSHAAKPGRLSNLGTSQESRFIHLGTLADLENAISNLKQAVKLTDDNCPGKPMYLSNLGDCQHSHFNCFNESADLEDAISNLKRAVQLIDDGHPDKPISLSNLGTSQESRFIHLGEVADLENSISNLKWAVELTDDYHPRKPRYLSNLGNSQISHFKSFGELDDLKNAISNQKRAVKLIDDSHPDKPIYLSNLGTCQQYYFEYLGKLPPNLENAVSNLEQAVKLTDDSHHTKPGLLSNLGSSQLYRFHHLHQLADLENAISNQKLAVKLNDDTHPEKLGHLYLYGLGCCQESRFQHFGELADLVASVSAFQEVAQSYTAYPHHAFLAARRWAELSHKNGDLVSALEGYRTALEILPKLAWLGLDASSHHHQLLVEKPENLGCLAATCAIQLDHLDEAVELLDMGRSVFWQQASSLRSDLEALKDKDKDLANEIEIVGRKLEAEKFSSGLIGEGQSVVVNTKEDIGRERLHLVSEWECLVERVRQIPQFRYFLKRTPFHKLRHVFSAGQVIIINASQYGVDALIFGATGKITHVPLPNIDLETLQELSNNIVLKRPVDASAPQQQSYITHYFKPTLRTIWNDIIINIFDKICIPLENTTAPPKHRIWWYLTGPLTFIPIHAAGPGSRVIDVSRLAISSYVTTLGSLWELRKKLNGPVAKGQQKFLSISQSDTPGESSLPQTTEEVDEVLGMFRSSGWPEEHISCLQGSDATVDSVSCVLDSCSWAHFACHGYQDPMLGMKSAFLLHDGHLGLSKIASKRLSSGQFAFLSACHAAAGIHHLPGEAVHLAAGIQFAGFPSVIATMWSICDGDATKVAKLTYQYLFRNGLQKLAPSDAATALNRAVLHLQQDPAVTVDRWAPFVHFGI